MLRQSREEHCRQIGLENLETAEKVYRLFEGNEHYAPVIEYVRNAYRDTVEALYINTRGREYDGVDSQIFKPLVDGWASTIAELRRMGEILNPVLHEELFPPQVRGADLSEALGAAYSALYGYGSKEPAESEERKPTVVVPMAGTDENPL